MAPGLPARRRGWPPREPARSHHHRAPADGPARLYLVPGPGQPGTRARNPNFCSSPRSRHKGGPARPGLGAARLPPATPGPRGPHGAEGPSRARRSPRSCPSPRGAGDSAAPGLCPSLYPPARSPCRLQHMAHPPVAIAMPPLHMLLTAIG